MCQQILVKFSTSNFINICLAILQLFRADRQVWLRQGALFFNFITKESKDAFVLQPNVRQHQWNISVGTGDSLEGIFH